MDSIAHAPLTNGAAFAASFPSGAVPALELGVSESADIRPGTETPSNPRKRKKASRACDFCHVNHQPCDNAQPRCGVCEKHDKPCLYLRPTKRRGPQKGYRTALNTYKESAAAWGAVLNSIPGLDALIEGHLRSDKGNQLLKSIKDPNQQEALINTWQQSSVFRAFFGQDDGGAAPASAAQKSEPSLSVIDPDEDEEDEPSVLLPAAANRRTSQSTSGASRSPTGILGREVNNISAVALPAKPVAAPDFFSLSDLVAKDAARASSGPSETLAQLGFAPDETMFNFYDMSANPEPISFPMLQPTGSDFDPSMGSEAEQRIFYELLMGRTFS